MVMRSLVFSMVCTGLLEELLGSWCIFSTALPTAKTVLLRLLRERSWRHQ